MVLTCHGLLSAPMITKSCVCQLHEVFTCYNCYLLQKIWSLVVILKELYDVLAFYFMYIYIYTHTHTHIYIYICVCVCVCVCVRTHMNSRDNVVSIMYDSDFEYRQGQEIFLFYKSHRPALRHTRPPIQWVPVTHSWG